MKTDRAPKVVVGTLTWNQKRDVLECLASLVKLDYPNYEIAVVDNGSQDGTAEAVRKDYPEVNLVRNSENLGCAEGVNTEIRFALTREADYLFIIANDAVVEPSALSELVRVAERDRRIGMVYPKVYYATSPQRIWFARGTRKEEIDWLRGKLTRYVQDVDDDGRYDIEEETLLYPGGFCLVRLEAVRKAGLLDPDYFIFYDDTDWLYRLHQKGFIGYFAPRAKVWHRPSSSMGKESPSFYYYRIRNHLLFFRRYCPRRIYPFFLLYFFCISLPKRLYRLIRIGQKVQAKAVLLGVMDYLAGRFGRRDVGNH